MKTGGAQTYTTPVAGVVGATTATATAGGVTFTGDLQVSNNLTVTAGGDQAQYFPVPDIDVCPIPVEIFDNFNVPVYRGRAKGPATPGAKVSTVLVQEGHCVEMPVRRRRHECGVVLGEHGGTTTVTQVAYHLQMSVSGRGLKGFIDVQGQRHFRRPLCSPPFANSQRKPRNKDQLGSQV